MALSSQDVSVVTGLPAPGRTDQLPRNAIYTPLDTSQTRGIATRLLQILPSLSTDGLIQCQMIPVVLEMEARIHPKGMEPHRILRWQRLERLYDGSTELSTSRGVVTATRPKQPHIKYRALSYLWGKQLDLKSILLNGITHKIGSNLFDFLDCARRTTQWCTGWWWIDALCIDQSNIAERNYQVQSMGLIYCHSQVVISWLGNGLEASNSTFDIARKVMANFNNIPDTHEELRSSTNVRNAFKAFFEDFNCTLENWEASYQLLMSNEYWSRAWVYQELFLGREHILLSASNSIDLEVLVSCCTLVRHALGRFDANPKAESLTTAIVDWLALVGFGVASFMYAGSATLMLRVACSSFQSTELKDLVFSQLSLIRNGETFQVDYAETNLTLFLRVLQLCTMDGPCASGFFSHWESILCALRIPPCDLRKFIELHQNGTGTSNVDHVLLSSFENKTVVITVVRIHALADTENAISTGATASDSLICPDCHHAFAFQCDRSLDAFACLENSNVHIQFSSRVALEPAKIIINRGMRSSAISQKSTIRIDDRHICLNVSTCLLLVSFMSLSKSADRTTS